MTATRTTCPYCGVGCGVAVTVQDGGVAPVAGDREHPANRGRLCVKGSALHETVGRQRRLLTPEIDGRQASWDEALDAVAGRLTATIAAHGASATALYLSGQLLTEDYYVANKLWKGFVGSANVDTNSRLCMSSAVAAHTRAFGEDVVPGCYEDLELADLVVLVGSNAAWAHPVLYQRLPKARRARPALKVVVIDPRRTDSCEEADLHLPLAPGSDAWLFNGLLAYLADSGALDRNYVDAHTSGFDEALAAARASAPWPESVAAKCGLDPVAVSTFFEWFAATPRTVTLFSQGINQSSSGTDKGNAIINCHLATGRVGKPGASPFSITGQPNAMGGREVGGLANMLAVHRGFDTASVAAVRQFWNAPAIADAPGHKAVDLFKAIERGEIRFLWILGTNPLVSLPEADRWRRALAQCETVVVSDCVRDTDTTALADILLPAAGWGEKNGTVTNSERCISRQRAFLPLPGDARPDWWAFCEVARRLGHGDAFAYRHAHEIFREHAALSGLNGNTPLQFDISGLADLSREEYDAFSPRQWPVPPAPEGAASQRLYGDGHYSTADGRARFLAIMPRQPVTMEGSTPLRFTLNTGRIRDQWHTMTRTSESARLNRHRAEPFVEIHPDDAAAAGVITGDIAELTNRHGKALLRVRIDGGQRRGSLFVPMHWSDRFASNARVDALVPAFVDPVSGQPELKHARVALRRVPVRWQALLVSPQPLTLARDDYWAALPVAGGWLYWLAGCDAADAARERLLALFPDEPAQRFSDPWSADMRAAWFDGDVLQRAFLLVTDQPLPEPWWLAERLGHAITPAERRVLLSGAPLGASGNQGPIVCSCYQVTASAIDAAIGEGCQSVEALGERLRCGTSCGSCIPEIRRLVRAAAVASDATSANLPVA
ncbi:MAG: molybdopterin-dependent oxidoreductase [Spongiibacteraceae bacterium]|jgi:assimilatory nitrate reductase catalytic subunit|nr:molybdopterin-dependent oxidoreductase [Spongiibacteraceae bacterium]